MSYVRSPKTTVVTATGQPADLRVDYQNKVVSVYIAGQYVGTWRNHTAAKAALGLVDVVAKKVRG